MRARWTVCLITAAIAAAVVATSSGVQAAPFAGLYRGVDISFSLDGGDGATYNIEIVATQAVESTPKEQAIYVDISRCVKGHCRLVEHGRSNLPDGTVSIGPDLASAQLNTVISKVRIRLSAATKYVDIASGDIEHPGFGLYDVSGPSVRTDADTSAPGTVTVGGVSCAVVADIFSFQGIDTEDPSARDPGRHSTAIPKGMLTGRHHVKCAA
jgi:hypothetical protein